MKNKNLNEAWYNTVLDVVGIFDPTGIVDLTNAVLYFRQGDTFFGILSLISVIPYVGDVIAKPLIGLGKGSKLFKYVDEAFLVAKTNPAKAEKLLVDAVKSGKNPMFNKLVNSFDSWGGTYKKLVDAIPSSKLTSGFKNNLKMYGDLLGSVKDSKVKVLQSTMQTARKLTKLSPDERLKALELLKKEIRDPKVISSFGKGKSLFKDYGVKTGLMQGVPRIFFGKNPALRSMMRNTKFYAGFLDFLGIANFVGPEELTQQKSTEELQSKMNDYLETSEGQKNFSEEFGETLETKSGSGDEMKVLKPKAPYSKKESGDFFDTFFDDIFGLKVT
jgi:hypothetical protein